MVVFLLKVDTYVNSHINYIKEWWSRSRQVLKKSAILVVYTKMVSNICSLTLAQFHEIDVKITSRFGRHEFLLISRPQYMKIWLLTDYSANMPTTYTHTFHTLTWAVANKSKTAITSQSRNTYSIVQRSLNTIFKHVTLALND